MARKDIRGKPSTQVARMHKRGIKRVLGLGDLFAIGYGDLGSSIYYALGITALYALGATPIALGLAGVVFICNALSYAELTAMYPDSGGSATFARHAFNDTASFVAGWGLLLDYIVTIAISAFAIGPYLANIYHPLSNTQTQIIFTVCVIALLFIINFIGVKRSTRMSLVLTSLALLTQIAIIVVGVVLVLNLPRVFSQLKIAVPGMDWSPDWPNFMHGVAMAMVAYTGIESIAQLGSESRKPTRDLPRAIFLNMAALILIYMGLVVVGLSAMTPMELGANYASDPLTGIVQKFHLQGGFFGPWVGWIAAILLFAAANTGLIGSSRLAFNLGEHYQLPQFFSKLHSRFHTPALSLIFFALLAASVVILSRGQLTFLADLYNFGAMIAFFSVNMSLLMLRIKKPQEVRPFKVPFSIPFRGAQLPISAIVGALASLSVWVLIVIAKPHGRYLGLAWMTFGLFLYLLYRRKKNIAIGGTIALHKVKVEQSVQHPVQNILVPFQSLKDAEIIIAAADLARSYKASITVLHIIEIPSALPLDTEVPDSTKEATEILRYAEAIIREKDLSVNHAILHGRTFSEVLYATLQEKKWQILVLPSHYWDRKTSQTLSSLLHKKKFRIWIYH